MNFHLLFPSLLTASFSMDWVTPLYFNVDKITDTIQC